MKYEKLLEMIKKRANVTAQEKIREFEEACRKERAKLLPSCDQETSKKIYNNLSMYSNRVWPSEIWKHYEEQLLKEVLNSMDTVQRLVLEEVTDLKEKREDETTNLCS